MKKYRISLLTAIMLCSMSICGMTMNKKGKAYSSKKTTDSEVITKQEIDKEMESNEISTTKRKEAAGNITLKYKFFSRVQGATIEPQFLFFGNFNLSFSKGFFGYNADYDYTVDYEPQYNREPKACRTHLACIMKSDNVNHTIVIDHKRKTYVEMDLNNSFIHQIKSMYKSEVMGKEKIKNYACTKVKLTSEEDLIFIWFTKDIKGYEKLNPFLHSLWYEGAPLVEKLNSPKYGIAVKMVVKRKKDGQMFAKAILQSVNHDPIPTEKFQVPEDYSKTNKIYIDGFHDITITVDK